MKRHKGFLVCRRVAMGTTPGGESYQLGLRSTAVPWIVPQSLAIANALENHLYYTNVRAFQTIRCHCQVSSGPKHFSLASQKTFVRALYASSYRPRRLFAKV